MVMADQLHNMYFLLKLFANVYLVDKVLGKFDNEQERGLLMGNQESNLISIAILLIVPFALLHVVDYREKFWKVGGGARLDLQRAIIRKYLNFAESSRSLITFGDVLMAVTRDAVGIVHEGFAKVISVGQAVGQLVAILLFQVLSPFAFGSDFKPLGFAVLFIFPLFLIAFLLARQRITSRFLAETNRAQDAIVDNVARIVMNYSMIADYNKRLFFIERYEKRLKEFNKAATAVNVILLNNNYFGSWLTILFVAAYTVIGGIQVTRGDTKLGIFLANLSIINQIGNSWGSIYKVLMSIQSTFALGDKVAWIMNLPTDLPDRKALNRDRRRLTSDARQNLLQSMESSDGIPLDFLTIYVDNIDYSYSDASLNPSVADRKQALNSAGRMEVEQGELAAIVGKPECGKSTLLKILGGVILPKPGGFYIPAHLRVLHVGTDRFFFNGSLFHNLNFGVAEGDPDGRLERVVAICKKLGMTKKTIEYVNEGVDGQKLLWTEVLTLTEQNLCTLTRALTANPELLVIHKPTMAYDEGYTMKVMNTLREFIDQKGVNQDAASKHRRRPRTCIMTAVELLGIELVNRVYFLSKDTGFKEVDKYSIREEDIE
eukprot:gnl/TRDRNA2_/TRDRNA2_177463_c0_seq24.p1 gnl/TRDRNA2_/TRDRNA2_177463_c0~~gnl/TRDRNA2_/TRDRNA2_177463_c0_seq24.p1  ORF type:complete len:602 (+),score=104.42 gnl/TRDRNA2_/TRDRNA2_177463_c0_seq24:482-2287(+)